MAASVTARRATLAAAPSKTCFTALPAAALATVSLTLGATRLNASRAAFSAPSFPATTLAWSRPPATLLPCRPPDATFRPAFAASREERTALVMSSRLPVRTALRMSLNAVPADLTAVKTPTAPATPLV